MLDFILIPTPKNVKTIGREEVIIGLLTPHAERVLKVAKETLNILLSDYEPCSNNCKEEFTIKTLDDAIRTCADSLTTHMIHSLRGKRTDEEKESLKQGLAAGIIYELAGEREDVMIVILQGQLTVLPKRIADNAESLLKDLVDNADKAHNHMN